MPFAGRERERALLAALWEEAANGRGALVLLGGEPGIGKTRLAEEVYALAAGAARAHVAGRSDEAAPFWVWRRALGDAADAVPAGASEVAAALHACRDVLARPADGAGELGDRRLDRFEEARACLAELDAGQPVLAVLEDLQWVDAASIAFLRYLQPDLARLPLLVVGTYRTTEVTGDHPLGPLVESPVADVHHLLLGGLDGAAMAAVAAAFAGLAPEDLEPTRLERVTGGNPLFARELARLLGPELPAAGASVPLPPTVRAVIGRRLERLDEPCRRAAEAASVLGEVAAVDLLAAVAGVEPADLLEALDGLQRAGLVTDGPDPGTVTFTHALVRQTAYELTAPARRAQLHARALDVLERRPAGAGPVPVDPLPVDAVDAVDLARHARMALPLVGRERAAAHARRAGQEALRALAHEDAARHLADALALHPPAEPEERTELLLALGEARHRSGRRALAEESFEEAAALARSTGRADHLAMAALGFGAGPAGFEVVPFEPHQVDLLEEALERLPPGDGTLRARVLARLSISRAYFDPPEVRRPMAEDAVAMARRCGDPAVLAYALSTLCDAVAGPEHIETRLALAAEMLGLSSRSRDREVELLARRFRVVAYLERGDLGAFDAEVEAYARVAERLRSPLHAWYVPLWRSLRALLGGDWEASRRFVAEADAIGRRAGSFNAGLLAAVAATDTWYLQGRYDRALEGMEEAARRYPAIWGMPGVQLAVGFLSALAGDRARAADVLSRARAAGWEAIPRDAEWIPSIVSLGILAALLGDRDAGRDAYERLAPFADVFVVDGIGAACYGVVHGFLAPLADLAGDAAAAARHREAAVAANRRMGATVVASLIERHGVPWHPPAQEAARPAAAAPVDAAPVDAGPVAAAMRFRGDAWELVYGGASATLRDSKGLRDLAVLLARPGREVAALDLAAGPEGPGRPGRGAQAGLEVLDEQARRAYRTRVRALQAELDDADLRGDAERSARAKAELDALLAELARATGLGGRPRVAGGDAERARKAVTARVHDTIRRVEGALPALGRHLRHAVRTGAFCVYEPEHPVRWEIERP